MSPLWDAAALLGILATLPGTLELFLLSAAALLPRRRHPSGVEETTRAEIAVVVPAHDEEAGIGECLKSLQRAVRSDGNASLWVVADNCTDATARVAEGEGARVLVRHDPARRGKGYALRFAWERLRSGPAIAMAVVDADSTVDENFVCEIRKRIALGADAVQVRDLVRNPDASWQTRILHLSLLAMNVVRPLGRERLGLSVGLFGNGFALSRDTLEHVPLPGASLAEDMEYHLQLVLAGRRVRYAGDTTVWAEMPSTTHGLSVQRTRWEGGRLRLLRDRFGQLSREVARGRFDLIELLAEWMLLPLSYHTAVLLGTLALPVLAAKVWGALGLAVLAFHLTVAAKVGRGWRDLAILVRAPAHVVFKLSLLRQIGSAAGRGAAWKRTPREIREKRRGT